jgi:prephenate dehydratase
LNAFDVIQLQPATQKVAGFFHSGRLFVNGLVHPHLQRIDRAIDALRAERARLSSSAPSVAYQGAPGAFSEDAARALAGNDALLHPMRTLDEAFRAVVEGVAEFAVIPVENSLAGPVPRAEELIRRSGCRVMAEHSLQISHVLIGCEGATLDGIRHAASHPVALAQCRRFFAARPHIAEVSAFDTAGAVALMVAAGDPTGAAIASTRAAALYGGVILTSEIQDRRDNFTRFVVVAKG